MKIGILYSKDIEGIECWKLACEKIGVSYVEIDLCSYNWMEQVEECGADFFVQRPEGTYEYLKVMYDEKLHVISNILGEVVFPSFDEVRIYENKKYLSYFLKANNILHAKTDVFYDKNEAYGYAEQSKYPFVAKTSIGAAGSGVKIIKSKKDAVKYIEKAFSKSGITVRFGPNRNKGNVATWISKAMKSPKYFMKKLKNYISRISYSQRGYVIFQEYIEHEFEWRVTKCGSYYYAYQKMKLGDKCSGTGIPDGHFINPPIELLDYVKNICDRFNFNSMAVDIFPCCEKYYINELQTHWGVDHYDSMIVDKNQGIYKYEDGWKFVEGDFWTNNYFDIRLESAIEFYNNHK